MNNVLLDALEELSWLFQRKMVPYWIFGAFASSFSQSQWIMSHHVVDLAFQNDEEYEKALRVVQEAGYSIEEEFLWEGKKHPGRSRKTRVRTPEGAVMEFCFVKNDCDVDYLNAPEVRAFGSTFRVFTVKDLKKMYYVFHEKGECEDMDVFYATISS